MFYEISAGSVTRAQRIENILNKNGYKVTVTKSKRRITGGCTFAVKVNTDSIDTVLSILNKSKIDYYGVDKL